MGINHIHLSCLPTSKPHASSNFISNPQIKESFHLPFWNIAKGIIGAHWKSVIVVQDFVSMHKTAEHNTLHRQSQSKTQFC